MRGLLTLAALILAACGCGGCYLKYYPLTYEVADSATYMVSNGEYQATAWAVDHHHLITAAHFCEEGKQDRISRGLQSFEVERDIWEQSTDWANTTDICVLSTKRRLDTYLIISKWPLKAGDKTWYVGYPHHILTKTEGTWDGEVITNQVGGGASGAAVYTRYGVVGIVIRTNGQICGLEDLKAILKEDGVQWTQTPDSPEDVPDVDSAGNVPELTP